MSILVPFFVVLGILVVLFVVVLLLAGFRPQRSRRDTSHRFGRSGGSGDGGTTT